MRSIVLVAFALAALVTGVGHARADGRFQPVPPTGPDDTSKLQLRVVDYGGGTNGRITVEIKNAGATPARFVAEGLFFVPEGDPDEAAQRLGAVGPFQVTNDREAARRYGVDIPPGVTAKLKIEVFCIDDERDSPGPRDRYTMARARMPAALTSSLAKAARAAAKSSGGYDHAEGRSVIQRAVWDVRGARRFALQGDGAQEE